jgi:hypothetical protein
MTDLTDDEMMAELGLDAEPKKAGGRSHEEARVIAGFEGIVKFTTEHGRPPAHGEGKDVFERLYAVRLDQIRRKPAYHPLLVELDTHGLLAGATVDHDAEAETLDDDALLDELGLDDASEADITKLKHVKPRAEIRAAEEIANRTQCADFDTFRPLFVAVQDDLDRDIRDTRRFAKDASIKQGEFFILGGQIAYVADAGEEFTTNYDRPDRRLRVIYDNGTESDILMRSLQRGLHKDEAGRRISDPAAGPLFGNALDEDDIGSGTCAASPGSRISSSIARCCTKSASLVAKLLRVSPMPRTNRPICSPTWKWLPPTSWHRSTGRNWKTCCTGFSPARAWSWPSTTVSAAQSSRASGSLSRSPSSPL